MFGRNKIRFLPSPVLAAKGALLSPRRMRKLSVPGFGAESESNMVSKQDSKPAGTPSLGTLDSGSSSYNEGWQKLKLAWHYV